MDWPLLLRWLHVIGATVLLGTGVGIAFFMAMAVRGGRPAFIAETAALVVRADWIFTASAVVLQPVTGLLLAEALGYELREPWILLSLALYLATGLFWLPVVWIQQQLRDLARAAVADGSPLPPRFRRLYRLWLACGVPAFLAVLTIIWLMLARPPL